MYLFAISPHCCTIKAEIKHHCCTELLLFLKNKLKGGSVQGSNLWGFTFNQMALNNLQRSFFDLPWQRKKHTHTLGKCILKQLTSVDKMLQFNSIRLHSVAVVFFCRHKQINLLVITSIVSPMACR